MPSRNTKKIVINTAQATRSLRSKGPVVGARDIFLANSATSGRYWTGTTPDSAGMDTFSGPEVTPGQPIGTTAQSPLRIPLRRQAKVQSAQIMPVVAEAPLPSTETLKGPEFVTRNAVAVSDLCPGTIPIPTAESPASLGQVLPESQLHIDTEMEDSEIEKIPWSVPGRPAIIFPQLKHTTNAGWNERCRKYIEDRRELLSKPFTGVSDTILQSLEDAERTQGGPKYILVKLQHVARKAHKHQVGRVLKSNDVDEESEVDRQDGSGEEDSQDLLECIRRVMIIEAIIRRTSNTEVPGKETPPDTESDFEGEPDPVVKYGEEERRKQGGNQDAVTRLRDDGESSGEEGIPGHIKRVKLSKDDLKVATELWDNVINPACIQFEKQTGKPAEAMREAIAGVIVNRVNQHNSWNAWQKLWWKKFPKVDKALRQQLITQCHKEYQDNLKQLETPDAVEAWTRTLEGDLAGLHKGNAAKKVVNIQQELLNTSTRAARNNIHVLFFAVCIDPYNPEAQAMSAFGVGSEEMRTVLVNNGQLPSLQLMLSDLKTKLADHELEHRYTSKLPPALGSGGMLKYIRGSETEQPDPLTKFKLFRNEDVTGLSGSIPEGPKRNKRAISRSCGTRQINDDAVENSNDSSTPNTVDQLPLLLENEALAYAVSQVQIPMNGLSPPHIFRLFVVLVEPPPGIDLSAIEGLHCYLTQLLVTIGKLIENGIRTIVSHCWWALQALCKRNSRVPKRADWAPMLGMLEKSKKRLINWCPSVEFPIDGPFPKSRQTHRSMANMFFNPDSARRLRLVPIEGPITDATPIIMNPVVRGGVCLGCTVAKTTITVDPSTVSRWYPPVGAVHVSGPTTQSAATLPTADAVVLPTAHASTNTTSGTFASAPPHSTVGLIPMTQGLGDSTNDLMPLDFDFAGGSRHFDPSDPFLPPSDFLASGAAAPLYEDDAHNLPFYSSATLGSTSSAFIPPSNSGIFGLQDAGTNFSAATVVAQSIDPRFVNRKEKRDTRAEGEPLRRRKPEVRDKRVVDQGPTEGIRPPDPVALLSRPLGMSHDEFVKLLNATLTAEIV